MHRILQNLRYISNSLKKLKYCWLFLHRCVDDHYFAFTYKGLLGLVHINSVPSQVPTHFWTFERKQLTIIFAHFKYIFLGIKTLWLVVLGKIIEIKLALEIIIKMEQVDSFYLGKWTKCCLLSPGIVKYVEYLWYS